MLRVRVGYTRLHMQRIHAKPLGMLHNAAQERSSDAFAAMSQQDASTCHRPRNRLLV